MLFAFILMVASKQGFTQDTLKIQKTDTLKSNVLSAKPAGKPGKSVSTDDTIKSNPVFHSPKKATIYSLVLPGLGQIYNRRYWKVPIVYVGFGVIYYFIRFNNKNYKDFRDAYAWSLEQHQQPPVVPYQLNTLGFTSPFSAPNEYATKYTSAQLLEGREYYRRNLEMSYMLTVALWLLQTVDAVVDAHFYNFSLTNDISLNIKPWVSPPIQKSSPNGGGLCLTMKF
jgi:hypothetical protein